jgi:Alpha galactosidase C-terminal beta sandwich domain/Melibiase
VLQFNAASRSLTLASADQTPPVFDVILTALPAAPDRAAITINLVRDYYRAQYVPYYKPIDRKRCPEAPTGWMSWNVYFDTAGEKENLEEARVAAQFLKPFGMKIFSIESWQDNSPALPVSKFHNLTLRPDPHKFPSGMKWLADQIRALGFIPGIWTVPFGTGDAAFYAAHKEWFLHGPDGRPRQNWCGLYLLDPSQAAVRQQMEDTHRVMSRDWGYQYFKIDGMSGRNEGYSAHFYERADVRAAFREPVDDPFRRCVEALRRGIGPDRIMLACQGHYTGPEVGLADAGRIGADIVAPNHPPGWNNYANQARATLNQLFVNNIVWYGDPDTLLVGTANPIETVRLAASVVALTGQAMFAGDKLGELPPERMSLLQQCLPVCDIRPLDLFPILDLLPVWDLKIRRPFGAWDVVSLFNWEEKPREVSVRFEELGLKATWAYLVYDCWNQKLIGPVRSVLRAEVPGHGNALLAVYPDLGRPQVVFSGRHLAQGGVDLEQIAWDAGERRLSGVIGLVENQPTRIAVTLPGGFSLQSAQCAGGAKISTRTAPDGTLLCTIIRPQSGPAGWSLQF